MTGRDTVVKKDCIKLLQNKSQKIITANVLLGNLLCKIDNSKASAALDSDGFKA